MKIFIPLVLAIFFSSACGTTKVSQTQAALTPTNVTQGIDHLALTVTDLNASTKFFTEVLGFKVVGGEEAYPSKFMKNGSMTLTLWQATTPESAIAFDRKNNVGLHHLAFSVASFEALEKLYLIIKDWPGVSVQFAPELSYGGPAKHMMFSEPSGNRIELIHRPKK